MSAHPRAVALGDQMHARMITDALSRVLDEMDAQGIELDEDQQVCVETGVGAGIHAALRVLVDMGLLEASR